MPKPSATSQYSSSQRTLGSSGVRLTHRATSRTPPGRPAPSAWSRPKPTSSTPVPVIPAKAGIQNPRCVMRRSFSTRQKARPPFRQALKTQATHNCSTDRHRVQSSCRNSHRHCPRSAVPMTRAYATEVPRLRRGVTPASASGGHMSPNQQPPRPQRTYRQDALDDIQSVLRPEPLIEPEATKRFTGRISTRRGAPTR